MAVLEALQVVAALLFIFFLPGFMLVQVLFPRKNELDEDDDLLYRIVLGIGLSIVITVLNGFVLGTIGINPDTGKGYFTAPNIWLSQITYTIVFFVWGYYRGAYPLLGRGVNVELDAAISQDQRERMYDLMEKWRSLKLRLNDLDRKMEDARGRKLDRLKEEREDAFGELHDVDLSIKRLGRETHMQTAVTSELQELVSQWRRVRQEIKLCDDRIAAGPEDAAERYRKRKERLTVELDEIDEKIMAIKKEV